MSKNIEEETNLEQYNFLKDKTLFEHKFIFIPVFYKRTWALAVIENLYLTLKPEFINKHKIAGKSIFNAKVRFQQFVFEKIDKLHLNRILVDYLNR